MGLTFVDPGDWKVESEICVPIRLKDKIIGVIDVEDRNPRRFEQIHLILLEWLATVASIAYSADQLESFLKTLGSRSTGVRSFAETILATLSSWSLADHGFIALCLKPNSECTVVAIQDQNLSKEVHSKFSRNELVVEPGRGLAGRALQDGQARYIEDVGSQEEYLTWWTSTVSEIVIPVLQGGAVMGLVNLEFSVKRDFRNLDRELLETLARLLSFTLSHQATERAPQG